MSKREVKQFKMFDRNTPDYGMFNVWDSELIGIASPPIFVYEFDLTGSLKGKLSPLDPVYGEIDMMDESGLMAAYRTGFDGTFDPGTVQAGEQFKMPIRTDAYYQESTWTQDLSRLGINEPEELNMTLNYHKMLSDLGRQIKIGDVVRTFRNKIYRVMDAYIADETVGWNYIHWHMIVKKPADIDSLLLPDNPDIPSDASAGQ
jgi:hypothetical protein